MQRSMSGNILEKSKGHKSTEFASRTVPLTTMLKLKRITCWMCLHRQGLDTAYDTQIVYLHRQSALRVLRAIVKEISAKLETPLVTGLALRTAILRRCHQYGLCVKVFDGDSS